MVEDDTIFLTREEAIRAIRFDFDQYPTQGALFFSLCRELADDIGILWPDSARNGVWVAASGQKKATFFSPEQLGDLVYDTLAATRPPLERLAQICSRVFRAPATAVTGSGQRGIRMETGMAGFFCKQCGRCCHMLDYRNQCTEKDYARLKSRGRADVLAWIGCTCNEDKTTGYHIWMVPGTRTYAETCPWLRLEPTTGRYVCRIYDVRPDICRQYPGSRKHALMTGCRGFDG
jgi:Fe-S-cluster containining protein